MPAVMVQGCTSWAGKSLLATALCRWYADQGLRVVPFKAQNMSTNARVVPDGRGGSGEIGVAQWLQAHAARVRPEVRMNPILVKPDSGGSQVVRLGHVAPELGSLEWRQRPPHLWPVITAALDALLDEADLVVCEGAGSPAEINLRDTDLANMAVARHAAAPVLLAVDIDRGGAFAHLCGTWAMAPEPDRGRLAGFVLNRFRGDPALLGDAPETITGLTGMACAGVMPMLAHHLPDEDGARQPGPPATADAPIVAIVRWPHASNLDEFAALDGRARIRWARCPADLADAELVVLPGSKDVAADVHWLHVTGLADALTHRASCGGRILGICGGLFALGTTIDDRAGAEGGDGPWRVSGLGLLPISVDYDVDKVTAAWTGGFAGDLAAPWAALASLMVTGYEIRHGRVISTCPAALDGAGWASGAVLGVTVHGLFEHDDVAAALVPGLAAGGGGLEATLAALGAAVDTHLDTALLARLTGGLL